MRRIEQPPEPVRQPPMWDISTRGRSRVSALRSSE
jgi:hypothetical protein